MSIGLLEANITLKNYSRTSQVLGEFVYVKHIICCCCFLKKTWINYFLDYQYSNMCH